MDDRLQDHHRDPVVGKGAMIQSLPYRVLCPALRHRVQARITKAVVIALSVLTTAVDRILLGAEVGGVGAAVVVEA